MIEKRPIHSFLAELASKLPAGTLRSSRVVNEVASHLEERASALHSAGMTREEAERHAVVRFGSADELVGWFAAEAPLEPENEKMIRLGLSIIVSLTSAYAALHMTFAVVNASEDTWPWTLLKLALGTAILAHGAMTWGLLWTRRMDGAAWRFSIFSAGLGLIALGSANAIWTAHLGLVTNDWEYYGMFGGGLLMLQGACTAWVARPNLHTRQSQNAA